MQKKIITLVIVSLIIILIETIPISGYSRTSAKCIKEEVTDKTLFKAGTDYISSGFKNRDDRAVKKGVRTLKKLIKDYPKSSTSIKAYLYLGNTYINYYQDYGHYKRAADLFQTVLNKYPDSPEKAETQFSLGFSYYKYLKDFEKAATEFQVLLERHPDLPIQRRIYVISTLAKCYEKLGQYAEAKKLYQELVNNKYSDKYTRKVAQASVLFQTL